MRAAGAKRPVSMVEIRLNVSVTGLRAGGKRIRSGNVLNGNVRY